MFRFIITYERLDKTVNVCVYEGRSEIDAINKFIVDRLDEGINNIISSREIYNPTLHPKTAWFFERVTVPPDQLEHFKWIDSQKKNIHWQ